MATNIVDSGKAFRYGWESLKKDFWYFIGISVLYLVITNLPSSGKGNSLGILGIFISAWLAGGLYRILLDYKDGKKPEITVLFTQFKQFWRILLGMLLLLLIVAGGFILFIVPGIILAIKYQFTILLIIDKDMQVMDALRASGEMTKGIKSQLFMFGLTAIGVMILGFIALGVGVIVAMPVVWLAQVWVYRSLAAPAVPTPDVPTPIKV
ncbi:MAG: DUF975 family protein [Patescibacteria group bacterium]|mgnify:CR=1 FL=1